MMADNVWTLGDQDPVEKIILKSMNEGVITLECNGDIFSTNPAALRILGFSDSVIIGKNLGSLVRNDLDNRPFTSFIENVIKTGGHSLHTELTFRRADGQKVDLAIAGSFLEFDACEPGIQSVVVVFRDITAFKSLERVKMRALNHLSHELKTPLAIIQASLDLFIHGNPPSESSRKPVERIFRNLKRLTDMQNVVEEIFDPPPFRPHRFPLLGFMEETLGKLEQQCSFRDVSLQTLIENLQPAIIDPAILELILGTLFKNAIENTPDQGEVIVSMSSAEEGLLLKIQDFGVGIPLTDQEFIFEAFHNTQPTDEYSTKEPFQFNAGGKGLELLRLKILSQTGFFDISFDSQRCKHIPFSSDLCPGIISQCPHVQGRKGCRASGGSTFAVLFSGGPFRRFS